MKQKDLLESALSSLEGMRPAVPGPKVLAGIEQRLGKGAGASVRKIAPAQLRLIAAGFALLLATNVAMVAQWGNATSETTDEAYATTSLVNDYNIYVND